MITDLNKILVEWAYRTNDGKPDVKNNAKLLTLEGVLKDFGWSREARAELLRTLMEGDEWWSKMTPDQQAAYIKKHPNSQKAQDAREKEKEDDKEEPKDDDAQSQEVDRSKFDKKQKIHKDAPNGPTQKEILDDLNEGNLDKLNDYQDEVERNREKGIAGMGGPVASEGESKYCKGASQDLDKWSEDNKESKVPKKVYKDVRENG